MLVPSILTFAIIICETVQNGIIDQLYCPSEMIVDLLTKLLPREHFKMLYEAMGMVETTY